MVIGILAPISNHVNIGARIASTDTNTDTDINTNTNIFYFSLTDLERNCEEAGVISLSRISRRELATKLLISSCKYRSDTNTPLGVNTFKILVRFSPVLVETLQWFWPLFLSKHPILPQLHKVKSQKLPCDAQFEQLDAFNKSLLRGWRTLFFLSLILFCRETG